MAVMRVRDRGANDFVSPSYFGHPRSKGVMVVLGFEVVVLARVQSHPCERRLGCECFNVRVVEGEGRGIRGASVGFPSPSLYMCRLHS